jgi:hypothetical protein
MDEFDDKFRLLPLTGRLIACLFELCNSPFEMNAAVEAWRRFGWRYTPGPDDEFGFSVDAGDGFRLIAAPSGRKMHCMILPFCWWPEYDPEFAESRLQHILEKRKFGAAFTGALNLARKTLGPPCRIGRDADEDRHRHAVWDGTHAWLILQQAAFDVQYGLEVNFWLESKRGGDFTPTTPLIDWLTSRGGAQ